MDELLAQLINQSPNLAPLLPGKVWIDSIPDTTTRPAVSLTRLPTTSEHSLSNRRLSRETSYQVYVSLSDNGQRQAVIDAVENDLNNFSGEVDGTPIALVEVESHYPDNQQQPQTWAEVFNLNLIY